MFGDTASADASNPQVRLKNSLSVNFQIKPVPGRAALGVVWNFTGTVVRESSFVGCLIGKSAGSLIGWFIFLFVFFLFLLLLLLQLVLFGSISWFLSWLVSLVSSRVVDNNNNKLR